MENLSFAFTPDKKKLVLKVFMNVENEGELGIEDHLLFKKELSIPENVWNLIIEVDEE